MAKKTVVENKGIAVSAVAEPKAEMAAIERAQCIFNEIACLADCLDDGCAYSPPASIDNPEAMRLWVQHRQLRAAVCQIGWMADAGAVVVGAEGIRENAERWFLSPHYNALSDREATHD